MWFERPLQERGTWQRDARENGFLLCSQRSLTPRTEISERECMNQTTVMSYVTSPPTTTTTTTTTTNFLYLCCLHVRESRPGRGPRFSTPTASNPHMRSINTRDGPTTVYSSPNRGSGRDSPPSSPIDKVPKMVRKVPRTRSILFSAVKHPILHVGWDAKLQVN